MSLGENGICYIYKYFYIFMTPHAYITLKYFGMNIFIIFYGRCIFYLIVLVILNSKFSYFVTPFYMNSLVNFLIFLILNITSIY